MPLFSRFLLTSILLPIIAVVLVCITIGKKPFDLEIAIYNQEERESTVANKSSLLFLDILAKDSETFNQVWTRNRMASLHCNRSSSFKDIVRF